MFRLFGECIGCKDEECVEMCKLNSESIFTDDVNLANVKGDGGSTPSQYGIPEGATDLQDLIEHRNMNFSVANIFKACYRLGHKNDRLYDLNKIKWFVERLINIETGASQGRNR